MNAPVKRRGRPKGSRNKRKLLSGDAIAKQCDLLRFNPVQFLVGVADGSDQSEEWTKDDRLRAACKLVDGIHQDRRAVSGVPLGEVIDGQFELVFVEPREDFQPTLALCGEAGSEVVTPAD